MELKRVWVSCWFWFNYNCYCLLLLQYSLLLLPQFASAERDEQVQDCFVERIVTKGERCGCVEI